MEDTLGENEKETRKSNRNSVLILVLMEDTLGAPSTLDSAPIISVLILVLMEDTLGEMDV